MTHLFAVQDEITLAIAKAMRVNLTSGEQARLIGRSTKNLDAYLKTMEASEQFHLMNRQGSLKAKEFARETIALDPNSLMPTPSWPMPTCWMRGSGSANPTSTP